MSTSSTTKWPNNARACISITLDNMGEAADINRGLIPESDPVGGHHSVKVELPKMLEVLDRYGVKVTYFVEGWNCDVYGPTMQSLNSSSHEIAFHAYQHEVWSTLTPQQETHNLARSIASAASLGISYSGFRPPGGMITPHTLPLMKRNGLFYLSPAASSVAVVEDVAILPFQWQSIDAYFYMHETAALRVGRGDPKEPLSEDVMEERLLARVDEVVEEGGYLALLFHPFLTTGERRLGVMENVVRRVMEREREGKVWVARAKEVGEWVREKGEEVFGTDPGWDDAKWKMR